DVDYRRAALGRTPALELVNRQVDAGAEERVQGCVEAVAADLSFDVSVLASGATHQLRIGPLRVAEDVEADFFEEQTFAVAKSFRQARAGLVERYRTAK